MPVNSEQLAQLWNEHSVGLVLFARARSKYPEDCVQEAFLRLAVLPMVPVEPFAWLACVVRNLAISEFCREARRNLRESRYAKGQPSWFVENASNGMGLSSSEVQEALMQLSTDQRELVVAYIWNGLTFRQMATVFDMPTSSVHRGFAKAMESLRSYLQKVTKT